MSASSAANNDAPSKRDEFVFGDAPQRRPSSLGAGAFFKGNVSADHELFISGHVDGEVLSSIRVVVEASGVVKGRVTAPEIVVAGQVVGDLVASRSAHLTSEAEVRGNIETPSFSVEPGATFVGRCEMSAGSDSEQLADSATI